MDEPVPEGVTVDNSEMEVTEKEFSQILADPETQIAALLSHSEFMSNFEYQSPELIS